MPGVRPKGVTVPAPEFLLDPYPVVLQQGIQFLREIHPEIQTPNDLIRVLSVVHHARDLGVCFIPVGLSNLHFLSRVNVRVAREWVPNAWVAIEDLHPRDKDVQNEETTRKEMTLHTANALFEIGKVVQVP